MDPVDAATLSDCGTERANNEDACGLHVENGEGGPLALVVVADGVSGQEGGEIASRMAVDVTVRAFCESPPSWGPARRLHRAAQQANIEIHDKALVVTELRGMSTTLTAAVVQEGMLHAVHVGDSRLYLLRDGTLVQKSKDHTVAGGRARLGLPMREKGHPDRSTLTHSLGRELIAAIDRISFPVTKGDVVLLCSDGLYNVLEDHELRTYIGDRAAAEACRALLDAANARRTPDNLTAAVLRITSETPPPPLGWRERVGRFLGAGRSSR
ncbi:MAG: serine/threonine-protein phosphatase [Myxococcales bacterium]|nr:serine/threonine-protein phosphatase [Myxococcales bacterium]